MSATSSSFTTLTSCWSGVMPRMTFTPIAASSTFLTNRRTTGKLTWTTR
jgi:hypothetical protein